MALTTEGISHFFVEGAAGNRVHGLDFGGDGPMLVCLHGVTGNAWNWYEVALAARGSRRVIALDFRGYGESQWSPTGDYSTADHVADLARVLEQVSGGSPVDLAGASWGALVAIQYAAEHPEGIGRLVVVDVEPSFEQGETDLFPRPRDHADPDEARAAVASAYPNAGAGMVEVVAATCYGPAEGGRLAPKHDPFFFERWPFRSDDHWGRLPRIRAKTLHVHASDSFVRADVMAEMDRLTPDSRLVEVSGSTHVMPVDNPAGLIEPLMEFLTDA
ncbi:MAG: alpha/beta hydrolase [Acidimicrobiaceae bacterium]|nr:alpha/beta hydrolase [Acidimicrobiaceae bacterium]